MTNEQTAIMLRGIAIQLQKALESAEEYLESADVPKHTEKDYIGKLPVMARLNKNIPESDYKTVEKSPICLDEIYAVLKYVGDSYDAVSPDLISCTGQFPTDYDQ